MDETRDLCTRVQGIPVRGFYGDLLLNKFTAFLEDEMASRRFCPAAGQRFDKYSLRVRKERVWEIFLAVSTASTNSQLGKQDRKIKNLGLPLGLSGRRISTEAVHLVVQRRKVRINIPEPTSLYRAPS